MGKLRWLAMGVTVIALIGINIYASFVQGSPDDTQNEPTFTDTVSDSDVAGDGVDNLAIPQSDPPVESAQGAPISGAVTPVKPEVAEVRHDLRPNAPPVVALSAEEAEAKRLELRRTFDEQARDRIERNERTANN